MLPRPLPRRVLIAAIVVAALVRCTVGPLSVDGGGVSVAFFGAIIGLIVTAFEAIASAAVTVAVTVAQVAVMIGTAIAHFAVLTAGVFVKVADLLTRFYRSVLRPFVSWTWGQIQRLHDWLARTFKPVIEALDHARKWIQDIADRFLRPVLDVIDVARSSLRILAELHVKWARELDRELGELEAYLLWPIQQAMQRINEVSNWVNRIIDLNGVFQRLVFLKSQIAYAKESWSILLHPQLAGVSADQNAAMRARVAEPLTTTALASGITDYARFGGGALAPIADAAYARLTADR